MADSPEDPITAAAKELVKQIPVKAVYKEGLSPAVQEMGGTLGDIMKTLRLVLAPVQALAAVQDRYRAFLDRAVRRVPEERRTAPPPQILGPVLESIRYEPEDTPIDEMFSELLSRSMDSERQGEAHPSYPIIIKQLSSDEAKLLVLIRDHKYEVIFRDRHAGGRAYREATELDEFPRDELAFPDNLSFYMNHLDQLKLAGIYEHRNQEPIFFEDGRQWGVRIYSRYRLTQFGASFLQACTPAQSEGESG
jgi:hypothetical protein